MRISDWSSDVCSSDLEVVAALLAHEAVVDAAEVDPRVRELMDEQRPGIQAAVAVDVFPLVGAGPRAVAVLADRVRGRTQREHVQHDRLAVDPPAVLPEAAFGLPTDRQSDGQGKSVSER